MTWSQSLGIHCLQRRGNCWSPGKVGLAQMSDQRFPSAQFSKHLVVSLGLQFLHLTTEEQKQKTKKLSNKDKLPSLNAISWICSHLWILNKYILKIICFYLSVVKVLGFLGGSVPVKDAGDAGSIPGWGRAPREGNGKVSSVLAGKSHGQRRLGELQSIGSQESRTQLQQHLKVLQRSDGHLPHWSL